MSARYGLNSLPHVRQDRMGRLRVFEFVLPPTVSRAELLPEVIEGGFKIERLAASEAIPF